MLQIAFEFLKDQPRRPKRPERLFFSLFPPREVAVSARRVAENVRHDRGLVGELIRTDRLHMSLQHGGDYKHLHTRFVFAACRAGQAVSMHPFEVTFDAIASFAGAPARAGQPRRRPLVLLGRRSNPLSMLHRLLGTAMEKNGLRAATEFTPHMTLYYGPEFVPEQPIEPIRFVVDEFFLIHSRRRLTQYHQLGRWPLVS